MVSLAEALPEEIIRVQNIYDDWKIQRDMMKEYMDVSGMDLSMAIMKAEIDNAIRISAMGDVIQMMQVYESLKEYSE